MIGFIITSGLLAVALILNLIGGVLKYRTGTPRELIAVILSVISVLIWTAIGLWHAYGVQPTEAYLYSAIVEYGIFLGLPCAAMAIMGWDSLHGIWKFRKGRKAARIAAKEDEKI